MKIMKVLKILSAIVIIALLAGSIAVCTTLNVAAQPDGSESDPWEVSTVAELQAVGAGWVDAFAYTVGTLAVGTNGKIYQCNTAHTSAAATRPVTGADWATRWTLLFDVDVSGSQGWLVSHYYIMMNDIDLDTEDFIPIGHGATSNWRAFSGSFDGQGYRVYNGQVNLSADRYVGIFASVSGNVSNLGSEIDVTGYNYAGGIAGYMASGSYVDNCYATGNIENVTANSAGGLIGSGLGSLSNSYATGNVISAGMYAGGLVGDFGAGTISNCYATGDATGPNRVGGLVGQTTGDTTVEYSYSTGTPTATGSAPLFLGGFVGRDIGATFTNNYWDTTTSGTTNGVDGGNVAGVTGRTTAQMQDIDTFTPAWDIVLIGDYVDETWYIDDGNDYPRLGWQYEPPVGPTVTSSAATNIDYEEAQLHGEVTAINDTEITERGFVWCDASTHLNPGDVHPTASDYTYEWTQLGSYGLGTFDYTLTDLLDDNTTYYWRAAALNDDGVWSYTSERQFTTLAWPHVTGMTFNSCTAFTITYDVEYDFGDWPGEIEVFLSYREDLSGDPFVRGDSAVVSAGASVELTVTGLDHDTWYEFIGEVDFDIPAQTTSTWPNSWFVSTVTITLPVADIQSVFDITHNRAKARCIVIDDGGDPCGRQFRFRKVGDPAWSTGSWGGYVLLTAYVSDTTLTGLDPITQYEVQARLRNTAGEGDWSASTTFWTDENILFSDAEPSGNITVPYNHPTQGLGVTELSIIATQIDGLSSIISFYDDSDDSLIGTVLDVASGTSASVYWTGLTPGQPCAWYVIADDGIDPTVQSATYGFVVNTPPTASNPDPAHEASWAYDGLSVDLFASVDDAESHDLLINFYDGSDHSLIGDDLILGIHLPDDAWTLWDIHFYVGNYTWYVTVHDGYDTYTSPTWEFTVTGLGGQSRIFWIPSRLTGISARITHIHYTGGYDPADCLVEVGYVPQKEWDGTFDSYTWVPVTSMQIVDNVYIHATTDLSGLTPGTFYRIRTGITTPNRPALPYYTWLLPPDWWFTLIQFTTHPHLTFLRLTIPPSSTLGDNLPGGAYLGSLLDDGNIPRTLFWYPIIFGIIIAAGFLAFKLSKSMFVVVGTAAVALLLFAVLELIPMWSFVIFLVVGITVILMIKSGGIGRPNRWVFDTRKPHPVKAHIRWRRK